MVHVRSSAITRREVLRLGAGVSGLALLGGLVAGCGAAASSARKGPARVGFLGGTGSGGPARAAYASVAAAMGNLGYAEGQTVIFEPRFPADSVEAEMMATELARLNLD